MITAALNDDPEGFQACSTGPAITRWEYEALSSMAAEAFEHLADAMSMQPEEVIAMFRDRFLAHC